MADLVILSGDIESAAPERVDALRVQATICGGKMSYERPA